MTPAFFVWIAYICTYLCRLPWYGHMRNLVLFRRSFRLTAQLIENTCRNVHVAVIRQGLPILTCLAANHRLRRNHIEALWKCGLGQHSSVRVAVYRYTMPRIVTTRRSVNNRFLSRFSWEARAPSLMWLLVLVYVKAAFPQSCRIGTSTTRIGYYGRMWRRYSLQNVMQKMWRL